jgi:uncharacterized protein YjbJ (UPF0337 family)
LQAQGKTDELTARIRAREMDATNEHNKALLAQVFAAEDAAIAANKLSNSMNELFAVADNRVALTDRLLQAQGKTEELTARIRAREMDATNKLNKARLAQVFAAEDAAIAAEDAANRAAIAAEDAANRVALTDRLLQAQGKTEELTARIRDREMDATNKLNKAMLAQVFAAEDAAIAAEDAAIAADALTEVNGWMGKFRLSLYDVSLAGAEAASAFVDLFGSLENFNAVSQSYYQNFYTDAERIARETELLSIEMLALGIDTLPATRAAFRALVDEADALGDSGLVASLMQLSPAFAEITAGADALGDSLRALVNEDLFATGQDYTRALSRGSNSQTFTPQQSDAELRAEMRALNVSMERLVSSSEITAGNTGRGADAADDTLAFQLEQTL